jgi:hypothetical protein
MRVCMRYDLYVPIVGGVCKIANDLKIIMTEFRIDEVQSDEIEETKEVQQAPIF